MPDEGARYDAVLVPRDLLGRVAGAKHDDNGARMAAFVGRWGPLIGCGQAEGHPAGVPVRHCSAATVRATRYAGYALFVPGREPPMLLHPYGSRRALEPIYEWTPLADGAFGGTRVRYPEDDLSDLPDPEPTGPEQAPPGVPAPAPHPGVAPPGETGETIPEHQEAVAGHERPDGRRDEGGGRRRRPATGTAPDDGDGPRGGID